MGLEWLSPLWLIAMRFTVSGTLLLAGSLAGGWRLPRGRELAVISAGGVMILGLGNGCLAFAEVLIPSGIAGLIITLSPFWMIGVEALVPGGERIHPPAVGGMLVGLAGAALLFTPDPGKLGGGVNLLWGFLILQVGMAGWSFGSIYQKRRSFNVHPVAMGGVQQLATGLAFAPLALAFSDAPAGFSARGAGAVLYLVVFGSIVGYSAYLYTLERLPVAIVSVYSYVNAVVAVALGWLLYGEPFGVREALAMAAIFAGVAMVKRSHGRKPPANGARQKAEPAQAEPAQRDVS